MSNKVEAEETADLITKTNPGSEKVDKKKNLVETPEPTGQESEAANLGMLHVLHLRPQKTP